MWGLPLANPWAAAILSSQEGLLSSSEERILRMVQKLLVLVTTLCAFACASVTEDNSTSGGEALAPPKADSSPEAIGAPVPDRGESGRGSLLVAEPQGCHQRCSVATV